jgi:hypothetical protein
LKLIRSILSAGVMDGVALSVPIRARHRVVRCRR